MISMRVASLTLTPVIFRVKCLVLANFICFLRYCIRVGGLTVFGNRALTLAL